MNTIMEDETERSSEIRKASCEVAHAHTAPGSQHARLVAELTRAVHARDAFIAIAAHELRNPMTPILGYVEHILSVGARKARTPKRSSSRWSAAAHADAVRGRALVRSDGRWKFFEKIGAQHPSFQFFHGYGLGVLIPGDRVPVPLAPLLDASRETAHQIRTAYAALGGALTVRATVGEQRREIEAQSAELAQSLGEIEGLKSLIATTVSERDEAVA